MLSSECDILLHLSHSKFDELDEADLDFTGLCESSPSFSFSSAVYLVFLVCDWSLLGIKVTGVHCNCIHRSLRP